MRKSKETMVRITILSVICLLIMTSIQAQIYYWVDENGVKHYSSEPPLDLQNVTDFRVEEISSVPNADTTAKVTEINKVTAQAPDSLTNHTIQIYTSTNCMSCDRAKNWLTTTGYEYTEYNTDNNEEYKKKFISYGGGDLPLILIDEQRMNGWQGVMQMVAILGTETSQLTGKPDTK